MAYFICLYLSLTKWKYPFTSRMSDFALLLAIQCFRFCFGSGEWKPKIEQRLIGYVGS